MERYKPYNLLAAVLLAGLALWFWAGLATADSPDGTISVTSSATTVYAGESVTLTIAYDYITDTPTLAHQFWLDFDPAVLQVQSLTLCPGGAPGCFMESVAFENSAYDNVQGSVQGQAFGSTNLSAGAVATVVLTAAAPGVSAFAVVTDSELTAFFTATGAYPPYVLDVTQVTVLAADVGIAKTASPIEAGAGDPVVYTLAFSNTGNLTAAGVQIADSVPAEVSISGVTSAGATITQTGAAPNYVWQVADLAPGAGGVITLTGALGFGLPAGSEVVNAATIATTAPEAATGNNSASATVMVLREIPTFSKSFNPATIGPGSTTLLAFTIANPNAIAVHDLAFTDTLPSGIAFATPANGSTTCGGAVTAADGGSALNFTLEELGPNATCTVSAYVTGGPPGVYNNVSGDLTSDAGNSGPASAGLTVTADRPGFSKSFAPASVSFGGRSTLTFLIDNTANPAAATNLSFVDTLPVGMVIADPANVATTCSNATLTAEPGSGSVSFSLSFISAGASCTVSVDVVGAHVGRNVNLSGALSVGGNSSGVAIAALDVTATPLLLTKSFVGDPIPPGGTVTLLFTLHNFNRDESATAITFSDDLDATLAGLTALGLPLSDPCGPGSELAGTTAITLTGGSLPPQGTCAFSVTLQTPAGAAPGLYPNTTTAASGEAGGAPVTGNAASDVLFAQPAPRLSKTFDRLFAGAGEAFTLTFSITNTSAVSDATAIAFTDNLAAFMDGVQVVQLPAAGFCGTGSSIGTSIVVDQLYLNVTNASLAPGAACTFAVQLRAPTDLAGGLYTNVSGRPSAVIGGVTVVGRPAVAALSVLAAPTLSKTFAGSPVQAGDPVTLVFTLAHDELAPADALDIAFSDDLIAVLGGLAATGLPLDDVCGAGSQIAGTTLLSFTGGSLSPGETCTFSVTLQTPPTATPGNYPNTTSNVTATVLGLPVTGNAAKATLKIAGLFLTKTFLDDPVIPGDSVVLEFTIHNASAVETATNILFADNLSTMFAGLSATDLPKNDVCGAGSNFQASGATLIFQMGSLSPGADCTFSATLQVPAGTASNTYVNVTSNFQGAMAGSILPFDNASDVLEVSSRWLTLAKAFSPGSVYPGDPLTLTFTLTNEHPTAAASAIAFADDLDAVLPGLVATGLPAADVCGAGSTLDGTGLLTLSGGSLAAGDACTFQVVLQVPGDASLATYYNATGQVSGLIRSLAVGGDPANAEFAVLERRDLGTLVLDVATYPAGETAPFTLTVSGGPEDILRTFPLRDGDAPRSLSVLSGTGYVLTESAPFPWQLVSAACDNGDPISAISVGKDETVACTLFHKKQADVAIHKTVAPATAIPGDAITYTLVFTNAGPGIAFAPVISDVLPPEVAGAGFISSGAVITQRIGARYVWDVADLSPGAGGVITISAVLTSPLAVGDVDNQVVIATGPADNVPANDGSSAAVSVLNVAPLALDDMFAVDEDSMDNALDAPANDSDANGDVLSVVAVGAPANGAATANGSDVLYTPGADFFGADVFTYTVADGNGGYATAMITVTVTAVNDPPLAVDDAFAVDEDSTDNALDVLANDSFAPDAGETLSVVAAGDPANGSATANGSDVLYTPGAGFFGVDVFTYTIADGHGGYATAAITVTVSETNDPPAADAGGPQMVAAGATVTLDGSASSDPNGDVLIYHWQQTGGPAVSFTPGISVTTFTAPGSATVLNFTLTVSDTGGLHDSAATVVTVTATTPTYTLSVATVGTGTVALDPPGGVYEAQTTVTLTATPGDGVFFGGWSGDVTSAENPFVLVMDGDKAITATFTAEPPVTYTLTVNVVGDGSVTPDGGIYISGTALSLAATPAANWQFAGWSGDLSGTANPAALVMDADKVVTATFASQRRVFLPLVLREALPAP